VIAEMCDNRDAGCRRQRSGEEVEAVAAGGVFRKIGGPSFGLRDTGTRRDAPSLPLGGCPPWLSGKALAAEHG